MFPSWRQSLRQDLLCTRRADRKNRDGPHARKRTGFPALHQGGCTRLCHADCAWSVVQHETGPAWKSGKLTAAILHSRPKELEPRESRLTAVILFHIVPNAPWERSCFGQSDKPLISLGLPGNPGFDSLLLGPRTGKLELAQSQKENGVASNVVRLGSPEIPGRCPARGYSASLRKSFAIHIGR